MNELNPALIEALRDDPALQAAYDETHRLIGVVAASISETPTQPTISDAINRLLKLNYALFLIEHKQRDSVISFIKALQGEF